MNSVFSEIINLFTDGVNVVKPSVLIEDNVLLVNNILSINKPDNTVEKFDLSEYENIYIIGAGKATALMAKKMEDVLGDKITEGVVVTKYGFGQNLKKIKLLESSHPVPDANGIIASQAIIDMCEKAGENDLIINLFSGGASSLLPYPVDGVSLEEKMEVTNQLLKSGANIDELNIVRRHLSKIKGGGLLNYIYPAKVLSLLISDVVGDKKDIIGSGVTVNAERNYVDCWKIIEKYKFQDKFPNTVISYLQNKIQEEKNTSVKITSQAESTNIVIGNNYKALKKIESNAISLGFETVIVNTELEGEAKVVGEKLASDAIKFQKEKAKSGRKYCFLYGGETTVNIIGNGLGGRNQELALASAIELDGTKGIIILSGGTDGNDGPTDAAGAVCNGETIAKGKTFGLDVNSFINNNDSYNYFDKVEGLLKIGASGTNVMDVQIIIIG